MWVQPEGPRLAPEAKRGVVTYGDFRRFSSYLDQLRPFQAKPGGLERIPLAVRGDVLLLERTKELAKETTWMVYKGHSNSFQFCLSHPHGSVSEMKPALS